MRAGEFLAGAYLMKGDMDAFLAENVRRAEVFGVPAEALAQLRRSCADMKNVFESGGHTGLNRYMLERMPPPVEGAVSVRLAVLSSAVGEFDAAFLHLDRALDSRDPALVHLAVAPQWDGLRQDPRFNQRLVRIGLGRAQSG
jgi:hypothetical protein